MDIPTLVMQIIHALAPLAPFLAGIGGGIGAGIVTKIGEDIGDEVVHEGQQLYHIVEERFDKEKPVDQGSASRALQNFIAEPDTYEEIFKKKLLSLLQTDPAFADEVDQLLNTSPALQQIIRGGNKAILRDIEQINTREAGSQSIEVGDEGTAERIRQTIRHEKSGS